MNCNYPIKYAVIPVKELIGWAQMVETEGPICYIVSKVYMVSKIEDYRADGTTSSRYQIVCPYLINKDGSLMERTPKHHSVHGNCINSINADSLYDNLSAALVEKDEKNKKLLEKRLSYFIADGFEQARKNTENRFNSVLNHYNEFESQILSLTQNESESDVMTTQESPKRTREKN